MKRHKLRSSGKVTNISVVRPITFQKLHTYSLNRVAQTKETWQKVQVQLAKKLQELKETLKKKKERYDDLMKQWYKKTNEEYAAGRSAETAFINVLKLKIREAKKDIESLEEEIESTKKRWLVAVDNHVVAHIEHVEREYPTLYR